MSKQQQQPPSIRGGGQRRSRLAERDVESPKNIGQSSAAYSSLTVGMTVSLLLGIAALMVGLGVGGFVGYFYDRENNRFGDIENTLADLQAQIDNRTAVTTFPDNLFAIFHDADPSRRFCFDALQIGVGMKRTITIQNSNGTLAYLADIPVDRAPNDATYLTLSTDTELTSERVLVMDAGNFDTSDFGPNAAFVVDLSDTGVVAATYSRATIEVDIKGRILSASSNAPGNVSMGAFVDDMFMVESALDSTRIVMLDVGGVSDSTTRIMTIPNLDGTLALTTGNQTFTDKIMVGPSNTIEASAMQTNGGAAVVFSGASAPIAGQLPTAIGPGAISWQTGATAVQTTGAPVDFSTASPPSAGQIPVFDGVSAINWQNITASNVAEFLGTAGADVNVGLSAQPAGAGYQIITTSSTVAAWTAVPVVASGNWNPVLTGFVGNYISASITSGDFMRIGDRVIIGFTLAVNYNPLAISVSGFEVTQASLPFTPTFSNNRDCSGSATVRVNAGFPAITDLPLYVQAFTSNNNIQMAGLIQHNSFATMIISGTAMYQI